MLYLKSSYSNAYVYAQLVLPYDLVKNYSQFKAELVSGTLYQGNSFYYATGEGYIISMGNIASLNTYHTMSVTQNYNVQFTTYGQGNTIVKITLI